MPTLFLRFRNTLASYDRISMVKTTLVRIGRLGKNRVSTTFLLDERLKYVGVVTTMQGTYTK
jgi:hypothetical protein